MFWDSLSAKGTNNTRLGTIWISHAGAEMEERADFIPAAGNDRRGGIPFIGASLVPKKGDLCLLIPAVFNRSIGFSKIMPLYLPPVRTCSYINSFITDGIKEPYRIISTHRVFPCTEISLMAVVYLVKYRFL